MKTFFVGVVMFVIPLVGMAAVEPSDKVQEQVGGLSPTAQEYLSPVFAWLDSARVYMAGELEQAVAWSKSQIGKKVESPTSAFIDTPDDATQNKTATTLWTIFATVVLYVLTILLVVVNSAQMFYIAFLVLLVYVLWKLFRRWRRGY